MNISFRKIEDQTYEATDGVNAVTVQYGWLRVGGFQWIVSNVGRHQWITANSRRGAAEKALVVLSQKENVS
jgi:hypothetical protein